MPDTGLRVRDGAVLGKGKSPRWVGHLAHMPRDLADGGSCTPPRCGIYDPRGETGSSRPLRSMPRLWQPARGVVTGTPEASGIEALGARLFGSRAEGSSEQGQQFIPRAWWAQAEMKERAKSCSRSR